RIAAVNSVGSAVFAVFVGGGGLGTIINDAIRVRNMGLLAEGTLTLMLIAVVLDVGMGLIEKRLAKRNGIRPANAN
ncbi:MAG: glycine/betaine ABC transporter permease, partial [Oscillospiraceae bacterium]